MLLGFWFAWGAHVHRRAVHIGHGRLRFLRGGRLHGAPAIGSAHAASSKKQQHSRHQKTV